MSKLSKALKKVTKSVQKFAGSKLGSVATGRFIVERKIQKRDLSSGKLIDFFGSPATAGTKQQTTARVGAIIYGGWMAGSAIAAKGAATGIAGTSAGSAAGSVAAGTGAAGGFWSGAGGTALKTATAGLLLSGLRKIGLAPPAPGEDTPSQSLNLYDPYAGTGPYGGGLFGEGTGPAISPSGEETLGAGIGNVLTSPWALIGLGLALIVFMFAILRR